MNKIALCLFATCLLVFNACKKTGSQGPQGPAGQNGNANVIGTAPFTVGATATTMWTYSSNVYSATFVDSDITPGVVYSGVVEIYKQYPADSSWTNLPDINGDVTTVYNFYDYGFVISVLTTDGTTTPNPGNVTFRAVIIPSSLRLSHPNTNWKNYNEAVAVLNETSASATNVAVTL